MQEVDAGGGCRGRMQGEDAGGCRTHRAGGGGEEKEAQLKSRTFTRGEEKVKKQYNLLHF